MVKVRYAQFGTSSDNKNRKVSRTLFESERNRALLSNNRQTRSLFTGVRSMDEEQSPNQPFLQVLSDGDFKHAIVNFSFPMAGEYKVHITVEGSEIFGSPYHVICRQLLSTVHKVEDLCFPRLIRISGTDRSNIKTSWEPLTFESLNIHDIFIIDNYTHSYQWSYQPAVALLNKAITLVRSMAECRNASMQNKVVDSLWSFDTDAIAFWGLLNITHNFPEFNQLSKESKEAPSPMLYSVQLTNSGVQFELVASGLSQLRLPGLLKTTQVLLLDTGYDVQIWEGKKSGPRISDKAGQAYLSKFRRPPHLKVTKNPEGRENSLFVQYFHI